MAISNFLGSIMSKVDWLCSVLFNFQNEAWAPSRNLKPNSHNRNKNIINWVRSAKIKKRRENGYWEFRLQAAKAKTALTVILILPTRVAGVLMANAN